MNNINSYFNINNYLTQNTIHSIIFTLILSLITGLLIFILNYNNTTNKNILHSLLFSILCLISAFIIIWLIYIIINFSGYSPLLLKIFICIIIILFLYKTFHTKLPVGNSNKNAFYGLISNIILYIYCLFNDNIKNVKHFSKLHYTEVTEGTGDTYTYGCIFLIILTIILLLIYYETPILFNKMNLQGGQQLINNPINLNSEKILGNYLELNGNNNLNYTYAISFWFYLNATSNTNASYSKYTTLLNYGNKPNISYNSSINSLLITIEQKDLNSSNSNKLTDFDENNNRILYKKDNILFQKWNNIIINYNGGILDVFLNGELVKSDIGVVPYYKIDNLTIGENDGIIGDICNVVYFNRALNSSNIYYLYNMVKNKTPPILNINNIYNL